MDPGGDLAVAKVAAAQRGLIHRSQLKAAGLGRGAIAHRIAKGTLHQVMPSVYAPGHPGLQPLARETAALLHARRDAVLSHRSAGALWGLTDTSAGAVHITVARHNVRRVPEVRVHRVAVLDYRDVRLIDGLPVMAPARTVIDLASDSPDAVLTRSVAEGRVRRLLTDRELVAAMDRAPGRSGVARVRALLDGELDAATTRSEAERRLLELVGRAQLPRPEVNVRLRGCEVDFLWRDAQLVLEIDGHAFHGHRAAFERDRERDQILAAAGYRVIRVTWRQLVREPLAVAVRIGQALARAERA